MKEAEHIKKEAAKERQEYERGGPDRRRLSSSRWPLSSRPAPGLSWCCSSVGSVGQELVLQVLSQRFCEKGASASLLKNETTAKSKIKKQKAKSKADALEYVV